MTCAIIKEKAYVTYDSIQITSHKVLRYIIFEVKYNFTVTFSTYFDKMFFVFLNSFLSNCAHNVLFYERETHVSL